MNRRLLTGVLLSLPLALLAVAWQAARYDALAADARKLQAAQESWLQENRKLEASIRVLSSRDRIAQLAEALGLQKAGPERRLRVELRGGSASAGGSGSSAPASAASSGAGVGR